MNDFELTVPDLYLVTFTEKINKLNYKCVEIKVRLRELFEYVGKENSTASGIVW